MSITAQPGDLIITYGTGFLSWAIEVYSGGPSHAGIVISPETVVDEGGGLGGMYFAESTIADGIDGVRVSSLPVWLPKYDGAVAIARLSPRIREMLDFELMWKVLYEIVNRSTYNKIELAQYIARKVPIIQYIPQWRNPNQEVCSELVAMMYAAGGIPGLDPFHTTPATLIRMKIWSGIEWIKGRPRNVKKFNTV